MWIQTGERDGWRCRYCILPVVTEGSRRDGQCARRQFPGAERRWLGDTGQVGWWKSDPDLVRYYEELDRKYAERRIELDMALLRDHADLVATDRRIRAADVAADEQWRAERRRFIEGQRDSTERSLRACTHFDEAACQDWADRLHRVFRTAADDGGTLTALLVAVRDAASTLRRDLAALADLLGFRLEPAETESPFAELLRTFVLSDWDVLTPTAEVELHEVRRRIRACTQLREGTRQSWLDALRPAPALPAHGLDPLGLLGPVHLSASSVYDLRAKVTLEARNAELEASLLTGSLELMHSYAS